MVEQTAIVKVVTDILKARFCDHRVYADEVQEGFSLPAFFIELVQTTTNETVNFNSNKLTIVITFLPKKYTALENMQVSDKIKEAFGLYFTVGDRKIKIDELQFTKTGENKEILQANLITAFTDTSNYKREQYDIAAEMTIKERVN